MPVNKLLKRFIIVFIVIMVLYIIFKIFLGFVINKSRKAVEKFMQEASQKVLAENKDKNILGLKHLEDSDVLDPDKKLELKNLEKDLDKLSDIAKMLGIKEDEIKEVLNNVNTSNIENHLKKVLGDAPNILGEDIYGEEFDLSKFVGNVIILDFFATWCPPCMKEIPSFVNLLNKYQDKGLQIVGVSFDENKEIVKNFKNRKGIPYPMIMANEKIIKDYNLGNAIPETFIINKDGNIVKRYVGFQDESVFENDIKNFI